MQGDGLWVNLGGQCSNVIPAAEENEGSTQSFSAECLGGDTCISLTSAAGSVVKKCGYSEFETASAGYLQ